MTTARETTNRLLDLLRREQGAMADFLVALADFDRHRLWLELGHASLFAFLHRELGLSAGAAFYRKTAAELIQRLPEVVEPLRDGRLCLTSICELAKVITAENRAEVLPRFFHTSKQEAKAVAAEIAPREAAPHRAVVTAAARQVADVARLDPGHQPFRLKHRLLTRAWPSLSRLLPQRRPHRAPSPSRSRQICAGCT